MLETTIVNTVDRNKLTVNLPIDFEELQERFVEKYGYCNGDNPDMFEAHGLSSDYSTEESSYSYERANEIAEKVEAFEQEYSDKYASAFFENAYYEDVDKIEDVRFYASKEDYLNDLYDAYGLSDKKFLWATVDMFLDDDYIFNQICMCGDVREASNGVIVEWL